MKIKINGVIVSNDIKWIYDWFEIDAVCPKDISTQIEAANGEDLEIEINSPGGDVYAGSEIYTAIKSYEGDTVGKIVGIAASAASVIAMATKKLLISPTAQLMIHNVSTRISGDYRDLEHEAGVLKGFNKSIANSYMLKTGMSQDELLDLMNKESWFTAQDALKYKLVDEVMFDEGLQLVAGVQSAMLPKEVIDKVRNLVKNNPENKSIDELLSGLSNKNEPDPPPEIDPPAPQLNDTLKDEQTKNLLFLMQRKTQTNKNKIIRR